MALVVDIIFLNILYGKQLFLNPQKLKVCFFVLHFIFKMPCSKCGLPGHRSDNLAFHPLEGQPIIAKATFPQETGESVLRYLQVFEAH